MESKKEIKKEMPYVHVRIPTVLKNMLVESAKENSRTMNTEIVHRLERSFRGSSPFTITMTISEQLAGLAKKVSELEQQR
jgi:hypothetical protein